MERAEQLGREIDRSVRETAKNLGENHRSALLSPLETIAIGRIRHAYASLTPRQQAVLDSVNAEGVIMADRANVKYGVYRSLVIKRLIMPDGHGNYRLLVEKPEG